jgi:alanyl-tRNA synthetase
MMRLVVVPALTLPYPLLSNMSERLYYQNSYTTKFKANIVERLTHNGRSAIILDETYFYPSSGGQPHDIGTINGVPVVNITIRKADEAILHWLDDEVWDDKVEGEIDWARRFDHMQHHTGQHILTQAFIKVAQAKTVSFHLSAESVTIDLHTADLTPAQIAESEQLANNILWQNRPITIHTVTSEQAKNLDVRKIPTFRTGQLRLIRLIDIEKFDLTACGGTHVSRTGEVGLIKIVKLERRGEELRVEFRCGQRALDDYGQKNEVISSLTAVLTTAPTELLPSVTRLQDDLKQANRDLKKQQSTLIQYEASEFLAKGTRKNDLTIISHVFTDRDVSLIRALANHLTKHDNVVVLFGLAGEKSQLVFNRSAEAAGQMSQLLKPALQMLGTAAGGGNDTFAQGGGTIASEEQVRQAIGRAERLLLGQL